MVLEKIEKVLLQGPSILMGIAAAGSAYQAVSSGNHKLLYGTAACAVIGLLYEGANWAIDYWDKQIAKLEAEPDSDVYRVQ